MSGAWLASYIALWAIVLFQGVVIFVLLRQLGVIYLGTAQGVANDGLEVGHAAPDFSLTQLDGKSVSLASFQTMPLVMIFGSPTCAPCRGLIPDLNAFAHDRANELGVLFLSRGDEDSARRLADELSIQVPVASHPDEKLPDAYQARVTPFGFLVDEQGVIRAKGLANNREHLELLLRNAALDEDSKGSSSHNGSSAADRAPRQA